MLQSRESSQCISLLPALHQTCNSRWRNKVVTRIDAPDIVEKGFVIDRAERFSAERPHGASLVSIFTEISAASGTIQSPPLIDVDYIKNNDVRFSLPSPSLRGGRGGVKTSIQIFRLRNTPSTRRA